MTTEKEQNNATKIQLTKARFDGYLPIVVDVETGGVNPEINPLLEYAAIVVHCDENGQLVQQEEHINHHVTAFEGSVIDPKALEINKIIPDHPFRLALDEAEALAKLDKFAYRALQAYGCRRAVLVGHNAHFDLSFLNAARKRNRLKNNPFHSFTCFDTATLSGAAFKRTVLAKALKEAGIKHDKEKAHSALYDTQCTADLFCKICNQFSD